LLVLEEKGTTLDPVAREKEMINDSYSSRPCAPGRKRKGGGFLRITVGARPLSLKKRERKMRNTMEGGAIRQLSYSPAAEKRKEEDLRRILAGGGEKKGRRPPYHSGKLKNVRRCGRPSETLLSSAEEDKKKKKEEGKIREKKGPVHALFLSISFPFWYQWGKREGRWKELERGVDRSL